MGQSPCLLGLLPKCHTIDARGLRIWLADDVNSKENLKTSAHGRLTINYMRL